ncbi:Uu.00g141140.m01.CDS01 [Anthostomella pinea]|uniref:Uu.00g141140.m01.CDS01 n=1 Tax=Anthostomella pinea TaxID=933095 RepID=A0AAI8VR51_9PEZI|nr:Uu.00g141140.m01.CDS01 [Anthostomella pinea]
MMFTIIMPAVAAIFLSFSQWATAAGPAILPCEASQPEFLVSDWTGSYTGDSESFTFYLSSTFADYYSGCSGKINEGAADSGVSWCLTVIPGFNVSFTKSGDEMTINHAYKCSSADGEVSAMATGSAVLDLSRTVTAPDTGRMILAGGKQTIAAATETV